ncbi:MAG: PadR family transcriptional regulator [Thermoanaerobaculia bacterium]
MKAKQVLTVDPLDKWREQLRRGGLELAILLSVSSIPRYGLEIIRYLQESTDLVVTEGTIYPILGRLTRSGVVEAEWISEETPHPRKYYRLSSQGRKALDEMLDHWSSYRSKIDHLVEAAGRI